MKKKTLRKADPNYGTQTKLRRNTQTVSHLLHRAPRFEAASSVSSLLSFDSCSIVPIYGYSAHSIFFACLSSLADLNENQLMWEACNLKMTSSFPINLALSRFLCLSSTKLWLFILEVTHHKRHKTGESNASQLTPPRVCVCVCINHELISWYDSHGEYRNADPAEGKHNYCSAMLFNPFTFMSYRNARIFTVSDDVIKGRSPKGTRALFSINIFQIVKSFNMNNISIRACSSHSGVAPLT